jgi:hypothetical protein
MRVRVTPKRRYAQTPTRIRAPAGLTFDQDGNMFAADKVDWKILSAVVLGMWDKG